MNSPNPSNWYAESLAQSIEYLDQSEGDHEEEAAKNLLTIFAAKMDQVLNEERRELQGFERRLLDRWRTPINLFKFHTLLHREAGRFFRYQYRTNQDDGDNNVLFTVLSHLHARSISVAEEILRLIESGHADGALARWRSIHEIACTARFIQQNGEETAQRFLDYRVVDDYHEMKALQKHHEELGLEPFDEQKKEKLEKLHSEVLDEYDNNFNRPHGWAHPDLDGYLKFKNIEDQAGLGRFRPIYKWASDQIHSDTKGTTYSLGTSLYSENTIASGPSNIGFTDPAQYTVMSLRETTDSLFQLDFGFSCYISSRTIGTI